MNPRYTIATVSGDTPPSMQGGWWTDLKRSSVGQAVSNTTDAITGGASSVARMTSNAYDDYVRPSVSVVQDTTSTFGNIVTGNWGKAAEQIESGFKDTLGFIQRQGSNALPSDDSVLPEVETGMGFLLVAAAAVGGLWYFTRNPKKARR